MLELHYPMIQFLIMFDILESYLPSIRSYVDNTQLLWIV